MGLGGMGGAAGAGDAMQTLFDQRMQAAKLAQQDQQFQQQQQQTDALTRLHYQTVADEARAKLEQSSKDAAERAQDRKDRIAVTAAQFRPMGSSVTPQEMQSEMGAGVPSALYHQTPAQPAGLPSTQMGPSATPAPLPMALSPISGAAPLPMAPMTRIPVAGAPATPATITYGGTQAQQEKALEDKQKAAEAAATLAAHRNPVADHAANRAFDVAHPLPQPPGVILVQGPNGPELADKHTGVAKPITDPSGTALGLKPSAQMQTHELAKGEAQDTLNQLEQALNDAKDLVGPGQGRVSNVEELVGNQDPRLNTLGTKMLAAKVKVNAALTPSVRSGMNPAALGAWDNLLANKITPDGLRATIRAMRDVVVKPAGGASGSGAKLSAAELLKKYGG